MNALAPRELARLDRYFKPVGPCTLCNHPDGRHRLFTSIMDNFAVRTRGTAALVDHRKAERDVAKDFGLPVAAVRTVLRIHPYRKGRKFGAPRRKRAA